MPPSDKTAPPADAVPVIHQSPFVKKTEGEDVSWSFTATLPDGQPISACIHPYALFLSLTQNRGNEELLVCGCSSGGCAGFFDEAFESTEEWIEWRMTYRGLKCVWRFDRATYEKGAIAMLREICDSGQGWDFCFQWYSSFDAFKSAVETFLAANPRFLALWSAEAEPNAE